MENFHYKLKERVMGMSSFILDSEEKFWDHAHEVIGDCESFKEFWLKMFNFDDITTTSVVLNKELDMFWDEFWVNKQ
tara:strand:- start:11548 stop:11778 length:231 start_codon:yes stop_codon:yes gene_type:complete